MMLTKKNLTKKIWYNGELWKLEKIFSPTKYDDYLLLSQPNKLEVHEGGIIPIIMILLDAHNDVFYPNTPKVRKVIKSISMINKERIKTQERYRSFLSNQWLSCFKDLI